MDAIFAWLKDHKDAIGALQSIVTVAAAVVGAWWAIKRFGWEREAFARANADATIACRRLGADGTLVSVAIAIENKGKRQVRIRDGWVEVRRVLPLAPGLAERLARTQTLLQDGKRRVDWPSLGEKRFADGLCGTEKTAVDLDPDERDVLTFEFVIPADVVTIHVWGSIKDAQTGWVYLIEKLVDVDAPAKAAGATPTGPPLDLLRTFKQPDPKG